MAVSGIIFQMITLFIMMFAGYVSARAGLISPSFRRGLSSLVLSTAFPCCIVSSVLQSGGAPGSMLVALGVSVAFFALMIALAAVLVRIVPTPKEERNLDQLLLVFTNLAFMGIPIIQALYGVEGVKNCHLLAPEADVSVSATELPVLGTVTLTEIEAGEEA